MASSSKSASASVSTSASDGKNCCQYDVFINHRGPDVKKTFASHLYHSLTERGVKVFLDKEELQKGDSNWCQIKDTIRVASVHIAIFSPTYALSNWCLDELLLMLESMRESRSTIIPIFFGVKPSQLRWTEGKDKIKEQLQNWSYAQGLRTLGRMLKACAKLVVWSRPAQNWSYAQEQPREGGGPEGEDGEYAQALRTEGEDGDYAQALRTLQNKRTADSQPRYDSNTIKKWKKALHDVADLNGFELEAYNHDEGQLLADVVQLVLEKIPKPPLYVSKYPTGLDGKVRDFEEKVLLQQHGSGEARVVGILGLGGVGKTTLAKEIFNRERINYRSFCFLSDVREKASSGSLNSLQSRLLEDLAQLKGVQINNTDEGIEKLRKHLCSSQKALIILDDVDHIDQLEALISSAKDVLSSSSLIIVTSRNKDVLTSWGIGDLLIYKLEGLNREQSRELFCWHAFRKPQPVAKFEQVLNELLDACNGLPLSLKVIGSLLYGKNLEYWKAQLRKISKILPEDIQNTLKISYDSLDEEEKHIFLDIACFFIGERKDTAIRIWDGSGWEGSLGFQNLQNKCLVEVKVKLEQFWDSGYNLIWESRADCIRMHDHLRDLGRYLADKEPLRRIWRVTEDLSDQSPVRGIKTSAERDSPVTQLSNQNFGLYDSYVDSDFGLYDSSHVDSVFSVGQSPQLTMLRWYNCPYSSLPSEISRDNLRILYITGTNLEEPWHLESQVGSHAIIDKKLFSCTTMHKVDIAGALQAPLQLRELYISAPKLQKIPESIGQLKHLETIVLRGGRLKTLPEEFCQLPSLKHLELELEKCNLKSLPDSFGNLTSLQHFNLCCSSLELLPDSFGNLTKLQHIELFLCPKLRMLPDSFGNLTNLQHIALRDCNELRMLPDSFGNLTKLQHIELFFCPKLRMLPDSFGNFTKLQHIDLSYCEKLTISSETLGKITTLEYLNLDDCKNIKVLPPQLTHQPFLQEMILGSDFKELPSAIGNLSNLKILTLESSCLEMLPPSFGDLRSLKILTLESSCLEMLPPSFGDLRSLEKLKLSGCSLKCFPDSIRMLPQLKSLSIERIKNLEKLEMKECPSREVAFKEVGGEVETAIDWRGRGVLSKVDASKAVFPNLQHLQIGYCDHLVEVGAFPTTLQTLDIYGCTKLEELPSMETLVSLEVLSTNKCFKLKYIHGLAQLTKLKELNVPFCSELEELPGVEHSRSLKKVCAVACRKLKPEYWYLRRFVPLHVPN